MQRCSQRRFPILFFIIVTSSMNTVPLVSILLPCYKEEEHLRHSVEELVRVARGFDFPYEFIFIEDASPDNTAAVLRELQPTVPHSKFIYHERNKGRGAALKSGYAVAEGEIVGYIDIDLEISPLYIADAIDQLKNCDVVVGNRTYFSAVSVNSIIRNLTSRTYKRVSRMMLGHAFSDTEAGFKFFRRAKVDPFFGSIQDNHWFWDTEFMLEVQKAKLKLCEMPVEFIRNNRKQSTVKLGADTRKYLTAIRRYRNRK
jgi:glycosyltransferase involved in cell wall biosynthesis